MKEQKCSSKQAEFYVNDLFETLDIKGNNQLLFNQLCSLLMKHNLETIKRSWREIVFSCELPNGQMAGRIPKMQIIDRILFNNVYNESITKHNAIKKQEIPEGLISNLWKWGIQLRDGEITEKELEQKIEGFDYEKTRR
jgi:hypothetical protein|tara:strand:- start:152 stop:568 length:417 start_codon:yes stop_codon:yes gene_type:complete